MPRAVTGKLLRFALCLLSFLLCVEAFCADNVKEDRRRAEVILNQVSKDVHDYFYDPGLKGLDWAGLTEQARQRIRNANEAGEMFGAISALLYQLHDSHTAFLPPQRRIRAEYGFKAKAFGEQIFVYSIDKDGPAAKAGLQLGDQIVTVNQLNAVRATFPRMMRYLMVLDPREELDVEVTADGSSHVVKIPAKVIPLSVETLDQRGEEELKHFYDLEEDPDGVESLHLKTFGVRPSEIWAMMKRVREPKALILDLRGNSGGLQDTMVELMNRLAVDTYDLGKDISRKKTAPVQIRPNSAHLACPIVVMIDSASASASEMLARSLQLHKRAVVIGDRSSGSVEAAAFFIRPISTGDPLRYGTEIATSRFVMENGEELEDRGVTPDESCIPTANDLKTAQDPCLDRARAMARTAAGLPAHANLPK